MKEAMPSVWIGIWSLIEGGGDVLKMKKWEKLQGGVGKACFSIRMTMRNFCTVMRNAPARRKCS